MGVTPKLSSLSFELRIVEAKNVEVKRTSNLFVRYYLSTGRSKRIQLNTKEICSKSGAYCWDESLSLECSGDMQSLEQESVVLELRERTKVPVLGRMGKSRLLGRAEVPWAGVLASPSMEIDWWVAMVGGSSSPAVLRIQMKVVGAAMVQETERTKRYNRLKTYQECGCGCQYGIGGCDCVDYDAFALVAAFESL